MIFSGTTETKTVLFKKQVLKTLTAALFANVMNQSITYIPPFGFKKY